MRSTSPEASAESWMPRLFGLFDRLDGLPAQATGAMLLAREGTPVGTVLLEGGRVCWAAAPRLRRRLTDLLLERSAHPLERAFMEALFKRCRREGKPLGEVLVGAEMVTRERLRDALFLHSSEALVQIVATESPDVSFVHHQAARYNAEFTFTPTEMLSGVGRVVTGTTAPGLERAWLGDFDEQLAVMAFARADDASRSLVPVHVAGKKALAARDLWSLGAVADRMLDGPVLGGLEARTSAFVGPDGCTAVAFRRDDCVVVVLCADSMSASRVFAHRMAKP